MTYPTMLRWALVPPILARASVSRLQVDALLRGACALKLGLMRDDRFEESLRSYFEACMPHAWRELVIEPHKQALYAQPKPYKIPLVHTVTVARPARWDVWSRRLAVLRGIGIRFDLVTLAAGEKIEPHGHSKVVSGFLVLEGRVHGATYDRVGSRPGAWQLRRNFDETMERGGFLTNAETTSNVHALEGLADRSLMLRVTVSGFPGRSLDRDLRSERIYVDLRNESADRGPFWATVSASPGQE